MSYSYLLAGENLDLAEAELSGFLKSQDIEEEPERKKRLAFTDSEPRQLKRLALTHEVCQVKQRTSRENLKTDYRPEKSFKVRAVDLSDSGEKEKIEEELGKILYTEENGVDLENPEEIIKAYILDEELIIGRLVLDVERGLFDERSNEKRPYSSPVSLDPVLARVLVNLSGLKAGETVLDPFCGTGGILIEAGLCGIGVRGTDIKKDMIEGCRENLEEYGVIAHDIREVEASGSLKVFEEPSAIITDLPYGKASKKENDAVESFLEMLDEHEGRKVFIWNDEKLGQYSADYSIYVHSSLTRYVYVVD